MSGFRFVPVFLLVAVATTALASCGDGKKSGLLAAGEYQFTVSGTLELEFPAETTSALPIGARQSQDTDISGDVKLKMNDDGSFEFEGWGIKATVKEDGGGTANLNLGDSTKEQSTGKTDKDGTDVDIYLEGTLTNQETRTGTNDSTIGASSPDVLGPNTTDIEINVDNPPIPFADAAGKTLFIINGGTIILNREQAGGGGDGDGVPFVLVQETIGCFHFGPGDSRVRKLVTVFFVPAPQNRHQGPFGDPSLLVLVGDAGVAPGFGGLLPLAKEPVVGATVTVTARAISGQGLLPGEESERAVTNAKGEARTEHGINKFGEYELTVVEVAGTDGARYQFDPASNLSETFEVTETCNDPKGW